jgi:hypothetical protein
MQSDIARATELFMPEGSVKELRILTDQGMMSGFFNQRRTLVTTAKQMSECDEVRAVYWGLNDIDPSTLKFITNDVARRNYATRTANIAGRRWMLIDVDPVRPKGQNSNSAEKEEARKVAVAVQTFLRSLSWPEPVLVDSANGYHSIYPISLPVEDSGAIRESLRILSWKFSSQGAVVDTAVHDACRIAKVPGTMGRKGPQSEERPWRQSALLSAPPISRRLNYVDLMGLSRYAPARPTKKVAVSTRISEGRLKDFFAQYKSLFNVTSWKPQSDGSVHYYLDVCPFNEFTEHSNHGARKTALIVGDTAVGFKCFADQCDGEYTFDDLLTLLEGETGTRFEMNGLEKLRDAFDELEFAD